MNTKGSEIFTPSERNNDSDDTSGKNITLSENVSGSDIKMMAALSTVTFVRGEGTIEESQAGVSR